MIVNSLSEACRCFLQVSELTLQTEDSDSWVHQHVGCYTILTDPQFFFLCHHLPEVQFATPAVAPPIPASVLAPDVAFWSPPPLPPSWRWGCIANLWEQIWWPAGCVLSSWPPSLQGRLWLSDPEAGQAEPELTQARGWRCCWTSGSVRVLLDRFRIRFKGRGRVWGWCTELLQLIGLSLPQASVQLIYTPRDTLATLLYI